MHPLPQSQVNVLFGCQKEKVVLVDAGGWGIWHGQLLMLIPRTVHMVMAGEKVTAIKRAMLLGEERRACERFIAGKAGHARNNQQSPESNFKLSRQHTSLPTSNTIIICQWLEFVKHAHAHQF